MRAVERVANERSEARQPARSHLPRVFDQVASERRVRERPERRSFVHLQEDEPQGGRQSRDFLLCVHLARVGRLLVFALVCILVALLVLVSLDHEEVEAEDLKAVRQRPELGHARADFGVRCVAPGECAEGCEEARHVRANGLEQCALVWRSEGWA